MSEPRNNVAPRFKNDFGGFEKTLVIVARGTPVKPGESSSGKVGNPDPGWDRPDTCDSGGFEIHDGSGSSTTMLSSASSSRRFRFCW